MFCKITLFQLTTPFSLLEAWLINCMSVRSVLLYKGVRMSSDKTIHAKKPPQTALPIPPHPPLPSIPSKVGNSVFQDKTPQKLKFSFV